MKAQISFCVNAVCSGSSLDKGSLNTKDISTNSRGYGQAVQIIGLIRTFDPCLPVPLISCQSCGVINILQRKHNLIYTKYLDKQATANSTFRLDVVECGICLGPTLL